MAEKVMSENAMFEYIQETPLVLKHILDHRKEYTKPFVDQFMSKDYRKLVLIGSGTSYHGSLTTRAFLEKTLNITVDANYPLLFMNFTSVFDVPTLVIGTSQGGESKSTIQGLDYAKAHGCDTVSLTEVGADTPVGKHSDLALKLNCGDIELAGPKTKGYQATMLNLALFGLEAGLAKGTISQQYYDEVIARIEKTISNLNGVIDASVDWYHRNQEDFKKARRIIVVGYDNNYGNMMEGRLKLEEAVRYGVEGYELEEFMHGIYHSIDEGVHLIYLAQQGEHKARAVRLRDFMADYSSHQFMVGDFENENTKDLSFKFVDDPQFCIFEYIIPLQVLAFLLSKDLGINANIPKIKNFHYLMGSK